MAFSRPAEVVQALYEESVNGSGVSGYCVGPLAEHLRLQHLGTREVEAATQSFEIRRLDVIESDAERAVVAIDGTYSFAERFKPRPRAARARAVDPDIVVSRAALSTGAATDGRAQKARAGRVLGGRYVWNTPYRTRTAVLEAEALDPVGKTHRARVEIAPARPELGIRLGRLLSWPRFFEAVAVAFTIWALQPDWNVSPLLIGGALLVAGAMRVPYFAYFWRQKARGPGVVVAAALAAAEFAGGLLLVLWGDWSWRGVAIVATALFIVGQAGLQMQAQSTAPK